MKGFSYVYILRSAKEGVRERFYVGLTDDLESRLARHNQGEIMYTPKYRPWVIKTVVAFDNRSKAAAFETYLKSASGRAFAKKRL